MQQKTSAVDKLLIKARRIVRNFLLVDILVTIFWMYIYWEVHAKLPPKILLIGLFIGFSANVLLFVGVLCVNRVAYVVGNEAGTGFERFGKPHFYP